MAHTQWHTGIVHIVFKGAAAEVHRWPQYCDKRLVALVCLKCAQCKVRIHVTQRPPLCQLTASEC